MERGDLAWHCRTSDVRRMILLFYGTTLSAANSILTGGVNRLFFTTPDREVAAEFALLRASWEAPSPAIVEVAASTALLDEAEADDAVRIKPLYAGIPDMKQVIFRADSWARLNRCQFHACRLDRSERKEIKHAAHLEQAG